MPAQSPPAPSEDLLFSSPATSSPDSHASSSGSGMSDERNADSVLFKLETVAKMHAAQQQQARQPSQLARLAAPAPASKGGSGLIDIKELAASGNAPAAAAPAPAASPKPRAAAEGSGLIDIKKLATAEASSHTSSSPSGSSNALLSSSSMLGVVPSSESNAAVVPGKSPSRTPLVVLSVLALLALAAAVAAIVLRGL